MIENKIYLSVAIRAALDAGKEIMQIYSSPEQSFEVELKTDFSPLTKADRRAHLVITERLKTTSYPILSEEGVSIPYEQRRQWDTFWMVDPLDGTKEFIKRNDEFTVNIAFISQGVPVVGVVYVPVKKTLYFAAEGIGAFKVSEIIDYDESRIEEAISIPSAEKHHEWVIVASRSHRNAETEAYINTQRSRHKTIRLIAAGSSLKICLVAEGKADIYPRFAPTMEWDTAAGHAIVRCAGGEIYQANTMEPLQYNKENLLNPSFIVQKNKTIHTIFDKMLLSEDKERLLHQHGLVIWMTGLSGSGKSTLAVALEKELHHAGRMTCLLDGDNIRSGLNADLSFSAEDRTENIRRIAEVCKLFAQNGLIVIAAFISPTEAMREMAARIIGSKYFFELFVSTPLSVCEERDTKGFYAKARKGLLKDFTGISAPFEAPKKPSLTIDTSTVCVEEAIRQIIVKVYPLICYE